MTDPLNLFTFEYMPRSAVAETFKRQVDEAHIAPYLAKLQTVTVGDWFKLHIRNGTAESVRGIKRNFNTAAKLRKLPVTQLDTEKGYDVVVMNEDGTPKMVDPPTPAPVILKWKQEQHKEKRVEDKKEVEVVVIDALSGLLSATEAVVTRAPQTPEQKATRAQKYLDKLIADKADDAKIVAARKKLDEANAAVVKTAEEAAKVAETPAELAVRLVAEAEAYAKSENPVPETLQLVTAAADAAVKAAAALAAPKEQNGSASNEKAPERTPVATARR